MQEIKKVSSTVQEMQDNLASLQTKVNRMEAKVADVEDGLSHLSTTQLASHSQVDVPISILEVKARTGNIHIMGIP